MRTKIFARLAGCFSVLMAAILFSFAAHADVQGRFEGPVKLKVWKHWQASWNVEDVTQNNNRFELERGKTDGGDGYISLRYANQVAAPRASVICRAHTRQGTWEVKEQEGKQYMTDGAKNGDDNTRFLFSKAEDCIDDLGKRIVTEIAFEIFDGERSVFRYSVKPMYVRGKKNSYWNNPIDPFSAHAGMGAINIATSMSAEAGWDKWDGVLVRPLLSFVDRNTLKAKSVIGLHRHEANQELYFIESGTAEMVSGIARRKGDMYQANRQWDGTGQTKDTDEFLADGGWIERRTLGPGEIAVIVPNGSDRENVYFHGIRADSDLVFWTMGSKN